MRKGFVEAAEVKRTRRAIKALSDAHRRELGMVAAATMLDRKTTQRKLRQMQVMVQQTGRIMRRSTI